MLVGRVMVTGGVSQEVGGRPWPTGVLAGAVRLRHLPPPTALAGSQQRTGTLSVGGACVWRPTCLVHPPPNPNYACPFPPEEGALAAWGRVCVPAQPTTRRPLRRAKPLSLHSWRQRAPSDRVVCAPAPQLPQAPPRTSRGSCRGLAPREAPGLEGRSRLREPRGGRGESRPGRGGEGGREAGHPRRGVGQGEGLDLGRTPVRVTRREKGRDSHPLTPPQAESPPRVLPAGHRAAHTGSSVSTSNQRAAAETLSLESAITTGHGVGLHGPSPLLPSQGLRASSGGELSPHLGR